jgi:hypothetical protein
MARLTKCDRCGMTMYYGDRVEVEAFDTNGSVFKWKLCTKCADGFDLPGDKTGIPILVTNKYRNKGTYGVYPSYIISDLIRYVNEYDYDIGGF